jgi:exopolysaccharide production protein ExoZ
VAGAWSGGADAKDWPAGDGGRGGLARLDGIQAGRAVAAIGVVITHGIAHPLPGAPGVVHLLGRFGITLFFVISGFIMVRSTGAGRFLPGRFFGNRLRRVVPLYWLACAALLAIATVAPGAMKSTVFVPVHFIKSMLFVPAWHPNEVGWIFPFFKLGWTLNYEMFFYASFALLFGLDAVRRAAVLSAAFAALVLAGALLPVASAPAVFYTRIDILAFVTGTWVGVLSLRGWHPSARAAWAGWIASTASIAAIALLYGRLKDVPATQLWLIAACTVQVALLAHPRQVVPRWLSYAGDASYSMYLFHMFGVALVTVAFRKLAPGLLYPGMAAATLAGVVAGLVVYRVLEAPMNRWLRRVTDPRRAGPGPIAPLTPADGL